MTGPAGSGHPRTGTPRWAAAAVATGDGAPAAAGAGAPDRDDAAGDYLASYYLASYDAAVAVDAFAAPGALERTVARPFGELPGAALLAILAQEQFTHGFSRAAGGSGPSCSPLPPGGAGPCRSPPPPPRFTAS